MLDLVPLKIQINHTFARIRQPSFLQVYTFSHLIGDSVTNSQRDYVKIYISTSNAREGGGL